MILARLLGLTAFWYFIFIAKNPFLYNIHLNYEDKCHSIQENIEINTSLLVSHPLYIVLLLCVATGIYIVGTVIDKSLKLTALCIVSLLTYLFLYS